MPREYPYPNLVGRSALLIESPDIGVPLMDLLVRHAGMKGILVPELFFSNDPDQLRYLMRVNRTEFAAVNVPSVAASHIADSRIEQVSKLPVGKTVIMQGFSVNIETMKMFESIASLGYPVIEKANGQALLGLFASMV